MLAEEAGAEAVAGQAGVFPGDVLCIVESVLAPVAVGVVAHEFGRAKVAEAVDEREAGRAAEGTVVVGAVGLPYADHSGVVAEEEEHPAEEGVADELRAVLQRRTLA